MTKLVSPYHLAVSNFNLKGYNGTILAYGQTGSGKTYTMQGSGDVEKTNNDKSTKNVEDIGAKDNDVSAEYSLKLNGIKELGAAISAQDNDVGENARRRVCKI